MLVERHYHQVRRYKVRTYPEKNIFHSYRYFSLFSFVITVFCNVQYRGINANLRAGKKSFRLFVQKSLLTRFLLAFKSVSIILEREACKTLILGQERPTFIKIESEWIRTSQNHKLVSTVGQGRHAY